MTKVKLLNGTVINASTVEVVGGVLKITTEDHTVEGLAGLFSNKENTATITLMTESGIECGYKNNFIVLAGINYVDGVKTVELLQSAVSFDNLVDKVSALEEAQASIIESQEIQDEAIMEIAEMISASEELPEEEVLPEETPEETPEEVIPEEEPVEEPEEVEE